MIGPSHIRLAVARYMLQVAFHRTEGAWSQIDHTSMLPCPGPYERYACQPYFSFLVNNCRGNHIHITEAVLRFYRSPR